MRLVLRESKGHPGFLFLKLIIDNWFFNFLWVFFLYVCDIQNQYALFTI